MMRKNAITCFSPIIPLQKMQYYAIELISITLKMSLRNLNKQNLLTILLPNYFL